MGQGSSRLGESGTEPAQEAACSSTRDLRTERTVRVSTVVRRAGCIKVSADLRGEFAVTQRAVHGGGGAVAGSLPAFRLPPEPG